MKNAKFMKSFRWKGHEVTLSLYELKEQKSPTVYRIGYKMFWKKGLVFEGQDFGPSPMDAIDSRNTALVLMTFLCLREGDTDAEYFKDYTPAQKAWRDSYACESLACEITMESYGEKK